MNSAASRFIEEAIRRNRTYYESAGVSESSAKRFTWSSEKDPENQLPKILPGNLTAHQVDAFLVYARLEEINRKLVSCPTELRDRLIEERNTLTDTVIHIRPKASRPSTLSKQGPRWQERIWIPVDRYPNINFVGLLIGPRGNTLKRMESESGARISIRGKGAEKEGKTRANDGTIVFTNPLVSVAEDDLHCMVMADTEQKVKKAIDLVTRVIERAASSPEAENEMKQNQLRELAILNGTLRDSAEVITCSNCGTAGHRKYECPERKNVTSELICRICNGSGHTSTDCKYKNDPAMMERSRQNMMSMEQEYLNYLAELNPNAPKAPHLNAPYFGQAPG